jgi:TPR repeat protein
MRSWVRSLSLCGFIILLCAQVSLATSFASAERAFNHRNFATALKELQPLAKQGDAKAQVLLARMYMMGYGVLKDPAEAHKWLEAAAAQGNPDAEFMLGAPSVLRHENIPEGLKLLRLSAEQGNQDAQLLLGEGYVQGVGTSLARDPVRADMWLRLAARNNLPFYKAQLVQAEQQMTPAQVAQGRALAAAWKPKHGLKPGTKPDSSSKPTGRQK